MKLEEAIQKAKEKWATEPQLKQERDEVLAKYGEVFKLENINNLTNEKFQEFLNYKHNKHWNHLNQPGGHLVKDMDKLKSALKILLDESKSLSDRIKRLRDKESADHIGNLGPAIYTPILLVTNPKKYPVVNKPVVNALDEFGLYSKKQFKSEKEWVYVPKMQEIVRNVATKNDLDLWKIDWVWKRDEEGWNVNDGIEESEFLQFLKDVSMQANYKPIVIKTLLEKGPDEQFTASIDEIKEKINLLNFDREDFQSANVDGAVFPALSKYVIYDGDNVSLDYDFTSDYEILECLKVCGQKIAQWHIDNIVKSEYEMWYIMPGSRETNFMYLDEFLKTNSIGIGWDKVSDISNFTENEINKKFVEQYASEEGLKSFLNFTRIKPKDIVVLSKGQEEIIDFGIVVSDYEFKDVKDPSYPHRKKIIWLKRGTILAKELPNTTLSWVMGTCGKLIERKQEMVDVLLEKDVKQYFLLQVSKPGSTNILENGKYNHPNWDYSRKNKAHGEIKVGDLLLVYFAGKAIDHKQTLKMIYQVKAITENKVGLDLELWGELEGISYQTLQNLIQNQQLGDVFKKIGQEAFNIAKITKDDFEAVLKLDGGKLSLRNDNTEDLMSISEPLRWKYHHMGGYEPNKILSLGIKFVEDFDGEEVNTQNKQDFMLMLENDLGLSPSQTVPEKRFGSYVTLLYVYGIGITNEKFIASNACKFYLYHKKDPKQFILSHLLKWQYPNGTSRIDENAKDVKIIPFPFTLKVLIKLSETSINHAYLSKNEILALVTQAKTMDEIDSIAETILINRNNNTINDVSTYPTEHWGYAARLFTSFEGTGLIKFNRNDDERSLEIYPDSITYAKNILISHNPIIYEWKEKDEWYNYHGVN